MFGFFSVQWAVKEPSFFTVKNLAIRWWSVNWMEPLLDLLRYDVRRRRRRRQAGRLTGFAKRVVSTGAFCVFCPVRDRGCKAQINAIADGKTDPSFFSPGFCASRMGQRTPKAPVETTL
jgi:hypothetical protein